MAQDIRIRVRAETDRAGRNLRKVADQTSDSMKKVKASAKNTGGALGQLRRKSDHATAGFGNLKSMAAALGVTLAAIKAVNLTKEIVRVGSQFETFRSQLTAVLDGNRQLAEETLKWVREFAAVTPFMTDEVVRAFIQLRAVGIPATREMMTTLGDVATTFDRKIEDVGSGLISFETEVLRRLGIEMKRSANEAIISSGNIKVAVKNDAVEIRKALLDVWQKRFGGAMKRAETEWKGMTGLLRSEWLEFKAQIAESGVFEWMKQGLRMVLDEIKRLREQGKLEEWALKTSEGMITGFELIGKGVAYVVEAYRGWKMIIIGLKGAWLITKDVISRGIASLLEQLADLNSGLWQTLRMLPGMEVLYQGIKNLGYTGEKLKLLASSFRDQSDETQKALEKVNEELQDLAGKESAVDRVSRVFEELRKRVADATEKQKKQAEEQKKTETAVEKSKEQLVYFLDGVKKVVGESKTATGNFQVIKTTLEETSTKSLERELEGVNQKLKEMVEKAEALKSKLSAVGVHVGTGTPGVRSFHTGGLVPGGGDVLINARGGEGVIREEAVRFFGGQKFVDAVNKFQLPAVSERTVLEIRLPSGEAHPIVVEKDEALDDLVRDLRRQNLIAT